MLALELCPLGNLKSFLASKRKAGAPPSAVALTGFICDVADAMAWLEQHQMLHRVSRSKPFLHNFDEKDRRGFGPSFL